MQTQTLLKTATAEHLTNIRQDFPILHQTMHGKPLVYLDNGNTTQKPQAVLTAMDEYYCQYNANIHRAVYGLSERATAGFESTRQKVQKFINAKHWQELVFVKSTTEAINLVAAGLSRSLKPGDEILITAMEHHSNIVPWQMACEQTGAILNVVPIYDSGELDLLALDRLLSPRTRILALTHISNVMGTINPIKHIVAMAHAQNIPVLVDAAQAVPHMPVDVQDLDCDFYVFSGHKMYGPTGIGVLYGKLECLEKLPPYQGGGSMIKEVSFTKTSYQDPPYKFEAGTQNIAAVIGLGAAIDYISRIGIENIASHEQGLLYKALPQLSAIAGLRLIGTPIHHASAISFVMSDIHPHDIGTVLASHGIAVRVGHHCAMPLMQRFAIPATVRISFAMYNTKSEIDSLCDALEQVKRLFN